MTDQEAKGEIIIYKAPVGPEIRIRLEADTIWMTRAQIAELFQNDRTSISTNNER